MSRLEWNDLGGLTDEQVAAIVGPGAPFEMGPDTIGTRRVTSFVRRPANLVAALDESVAKRGDLVIFVDGDRTWTLSEAATDIGRIARVLVDDYGIVPGDRVGIVAANSAEYALTMWAIVSIGAICTGLNGWWTPVELARGLDLVGAKVVFGDERRLASAAAANADNIPMRQLDDVYAQARSVAPLPANERPPVDEDDPAIILFTSGTTGFAKGATLSHRGLVCFAQIMQLMSAIGMARAGRTSAPQPASILVGPMFHISGLSGSMLVGPLGGTKQVISPPGKWEVERQLALTQDHRITGWTCVPTQLWRVVNFPGLDDYDTSSLATINCGGSTFAPDLIRAFHERFPNVLLSNGYGMSESSGAGTRFSGAALLDHPTAVGAVNATIEIEIRDDEGRVLPQGDVGEIYVRSPCVFLGYWNDDEATKMSVSDDGWYRTGDYGRVEADLLYLESRIRDMIIRGGENIYPIEIENRLVEHPDIADAGVAGVDHPELGQEVKAFVVMCAGATLDAAAVQEWARGGLAAYKVPAHVAFVDELPYNDTGKLVRQKLL
ncbi:MAG: class I adenylate-forming enzyme family protein [Acidimicrobiia bacterium]